jgi:hypothetical protein
VLIDRGWFMVDDGRSIDHGRSINAQLPQRPTLTIKHAQASVFYTLIKQTVSANLRSTLDSIYVIMIIIPVLFLKFFFEMLCASTTCKHLILQWIGSCLHSNMPRQRVGFDKYNILWY